MTDAHIISIAIIFIAAIGSIMYNNSRITDLRVAIDGRFSGIDKRMDDLRNSVNQHLDDKFKLLDTKLDRIIEMLASHDARLYKLEHPDER
ncbi:MAG TPA: hypothetical protein VFB14_19685 [Bryobacteraceae bacterium]|nr:hypothetical protein [Bryobacteraceae bacterium]